MLAVSVLRALPGRPADGIFWQRRIGILALGAVLRPLYGGFLREIMARCCNSLEILSKIFSKNFKFPLCKMEKMEYNKLQ